MVRGMPKKRVLLVDDNAVVRIAVRRLVRLPPNFEVVGEAEHGREAVEKAPSLRPDLIVLDLSMPVMNGLEAAPLLIKILPNVWLILFTAHDDPEVQPAITCGRHTRRCSEKQSGNPLDRAGRIASLSNVKHC